MTVLCMMSFLPADKSRGLRGGWGSGIMGLCPLGTSEPIGGVGCWGSAILGVLSAERGAAPTLTAMPPGWGKSVNKGQEKKDTVMPVFWILSVLMLQQQQFK